MTVEAALSSINPAAWPWTMTSSHEINNTIRVYSTWSTVHVLRTPVRSVSTVELQMDAERTPSCEKAITKTYHFVHPLAVHGGAGPAAIIIESAAADGVALCGPQSAAPLDPRV